MKNIERLLTIAIFSIVLFAGCKKNVADENGCYADIATASQNALKNNQNIFLIITMDGDDDESENFIKNVMEDKNFKEKIASKYSVAHMDFSAKTNRKTIVKENSSKKQRKAAESYFKLLKENVIFASLMDVTSTPSFYLLTKEKYFIAELYEQAPVSSVEELEFLLTSQDERVSDFVKKVERTKKGSKKEKIAAIQALFDEIPDKYLPLFEPITEKMLSLDKNNSTGNLSKYLMAKADAKSTRCFFENDAVGAAKSYISICDNKYLTPNDRQDAYFSAASIFALTKSAKDDVIEKTLQKAIDANPESDKVSTIQRFIDYVKTPPQEQTD